jgi:hypothetical protein
LLQSAVWPVFRLDDGPKRLAEMRIARDSVKHVAHHALWCMHVDCDGSAF